MVGDFLVNVLYSAKVVMLSSPSMRISTLVLIGTLTCPYMQSEPVVMEEDDTPLLGGRQRETKHPKKDDSAKESVNLENMVLFHGKVRDPWTDLTSVACKGAV